MILVTGGAGFIGTNFILHWLSGSDEPVINLDLLTYAGHTENLAGIEHDPRYRFVQGDIGDHTLVSRLLAEHRPRAVLNFAAETHVDRSIHGPAAFVQTNLVGSFHLLEAVRAHWNALDSAGRTGFRFVHVSTDEVFGSLEPSAPAFTEASPYRPNSPYAASKAGADHLVRAYHHTYGLPLLVTHCSNNYGPFQHPEKLIPLMIHHALAGKPLPVYGDGQHVRDWLYVGDHCAALCRVLADGRAGQVYAIGGNAECSNLAVVQAICARLDQLAPRADGRPYATQITRVADRPGHDRRYAINSTKVRTELGWAPRETFPTGLTRTIHWYLEHGDWVRQVTGLDHQAWMATNYTPEARGA